MSTPSVDDDALDSYRAMTPYQKAAHEAALWAERVRVAVDRPRERRGIEALGTALRVSGYEIRARNALWLAGDTAAPLWSRLERGTLTLSEAVRYTRQAERERRQTRGNVSVRLAQILGDTTALRTLCPPDPTSAPPMNRDAFLSGMRALVGAYTAHALAEHDAPSRARLRKILEADIALAVSMFHQQARGAARVDLDTVMVVTVSRKKVIEACHVLSMDPPRVNKPADAALAKRQYRALARLFHPDVSDAPNAEEVFGNATAAYKTISDYNQSLERTDDDATG